MITNPKTRVIDASTAFRTAPGWAYGLPEPTKTQRQLMETGIIAADYPVTCSAVSDYSLPHRQRR